MSHNSILVVEDGNLPPEVPLEFVCNVGSAMASAHILNVLGVAGATTIGSGNTIDINVSTTGFTWNVVTSATNPNQLVAENGYICAGTNLVTFMLPLAPTVGDTFKIFSFTSRFQIIPNASQQLVIGAVTGLVGVMGTATSNAPGDEITMTFMGMNGGSNVFQSESPQGTLTVDTS
jgi:hypothetical protein